MDIYKLCGGGDVPEPSPSDRVERKYPQGLGLGASIPSSTPNDHSLIIKKERKIQIFAGKHKDCFGTVESFSDRCDRLEIRIETSNGDSKVEVSANLVKVATRKVFDRSVRKLQSQRSTSTGNPGSQRRQRSRSPTT